MLRTFSLFCPFLLTVLLLAMGAVLGCTKDDHCVPSSCCHATLCVDRTRAAAPNCSDVLCSAGCELDTLDCGGECRCAKNKVCAPFIRIGMPPDSATSRQWVSGQPPPPPPQQRVVHLTRRVSRKS